MGASKRILPLQGLSEEQYGREENIALRTLCVRRVFATVTGRIISRYKSVQDERELSSIRWQSHRTMINIRRSRSGHGQEGRNAIRKLPPCELA